VPKKPRRKSDVKKLAPVGYPLHVHIQAAQDAKAQSRLWTGIDRNRRADELYFGRRRRFLSARGRGTRSAMRVPHNLNPSSFRGRPAVARSAF